ncbi:response regulator transcription factor [Billgrantia gudaonensis]|uniref:Regulatory protein, luxR family n=1 Tax=Billgrantia gudaonensis TaxID=376427 RepID=A0A1G9D958_9GAMM|nr:response regulator transcription factor [Halomonas gudaonensis]SDK60274.1 regulatory protein, luxR family [Halomonas gudaonensis]
MAHWFVSHGRDEFPRWREAFPAARLVSAADAKLLAMPGDAVWIMDDTPQWPSLAMPLGQRGVIVVIMSLAPSGHDALQALQAGARGYLHALAKPALMEQAALVTQNQGIWVPADLMGRVLGATYQALGGEPRLPSDELSALTERERDVALAVARGKSNKEVARHLDITERTVKAHLGAVFRKLGVRDRMQLVLRLGQHAEVS